MKREEQIEKARELLACGALSKEACDAIKADFPELAESEDERIRKWLVELVKNTDTNHSNIKLSENCKLALAYLEKQKPAESDAIKGGDYCVEDIEETARHFYELGKKQQMLKEEVEVVVVDDWQYGKDTDGAKPAIKVRNPDWKIGDKKKVIISK